MTIEVHSLTEANMTDFVEDNRIPDDAIVSLMDQTKARELAGQLSAAADGGEIVALVVRKTPS